MGKGQDPPGCADSLSQESGHVTSARAGATWIYTGGSDGAPRLEVATHYCLLAGFRHRGEGRWGGVEYKGEGHRLGASPPGLKSQVYHLRASAS